MKVDFKKLPGSQVELRCEMEFSEFRPFVEEALRRIAQNVDLPGFRKGKAPLDLVIERVGKLHIYEHAAQDAVQKQYEVFVSEYGFKPIGSPQVEVLKLAPENSFEFKIIVAVIPEVQLPDYHMLLKGLKHQKREPEITEAMVQDALVWLQKSRAQLIPLDRPSQKGDVLIIDFVMRHNDKIVENGEQKNFTLTLGKAKIIETVEEQLIGMKKGEKKTFIVDIPPDYWNKAIAGKSIEFSVVVKQVQQEVLPELNNAFAQSLGRFDSLNQLKDSVRQGLIMEQEEKEKQRFRLVLLKHIDEHVKLELPLVLLETEISAMVRAFRNSIEEAGLSWEKYLEEIGKTEQDLRKEFTAQAEERVRFALILDAIGEKEKIKISDDEIEREANKYLSRFRSVKEAESHIDSQTLIAYTRDAIRNEKIYQLLEKLALEE